MLFQFIKEYHNIFSQRNYWAELPFLSEGIDEWIKNTGAKHNVNVVIFAYDWIERFYDNEDSWPVTHRRKSNDSWHKYDYDYKQKSNLFNLDSLYRKMPKKSFTRVFQLPRNVQKLMELPDQEMLDIMTIS